MDYAPPRAHRDYAHRAAHKPALDAIAYQMPHRADRDGYTPSLSLSTPSSSPTTASSSPPPPTSPLSHPFARHAHGAYPARADADAVRIHAARDSSPFAPRSCARPDALPVPRCAERHAYAKRREPVFDESDYDDHRESLPPPARARAPCALRCSACAPRVLADSVPARRGPRCAVSPGGSLA